MPHSNPTPDQIQRLIAKLLGLCACGRCQDNGHGICCNCHKPWPQIENWPGDRNASYELLKDYNINFKSSAVISAYDESMIFIELKGYRWETCDSCEGQPHGVSEDCTDCNVQGGKFVKEVTDD